MALSTTIDCQNWIKSALLVTLALSLIGISKKKILGSREMLVGTQKLQVSPPPMCF